jgi:hypothetical protein
MQTGLLARRARRDGFPCSVRSASRGSPGPRRGIELGTGEGAVVGVGRHSLRAWRCTRAWGWEGEAMASGGMAVSRSGVEEAALEQRLVTAVLAGEQADEDAGLVDAVDDAPWWIAELAGVAQAEGL